MMKLLPFSSLGEYLRELLTADGIEINEREFSTDDGIQELLPDPFVSQELCLRKENLVFCPFMMLSQLLKGGWS